MKKTILLAASVALFTVKTGAQVFFKPILTDTSIVVVKEDEFSIIDAVDVFDGKIDPGFKKLNFDVVDSCDTAILQEIKVFELIKNGKLTDMFGSLDTNTEKLCLNDKQVVLFFRKNKNLFPPKSWIMAPFKLGNDIFLAMVHLNLDSTLYIRYSKIEGRIFWRGFEYFTVVKKFK